MAVEAAVPTTDAAYERFFQAQHHYLYGDNREIGWSQGFSCRRSLALKAGLFAEELRCPAAKTANSWSVCRACTSRRVIDKTIVVRHVTPSTIGDSGDSGRAEAWPSRSCVTRMHHTTWPSLIVERLAAAVWSALLVVTVVPMLRRAAC